MPANICSVDVSRMSEDVEVERRRDEPARRSPASLPSCDLWEELGASSSVRRDETG